jgi:hypothetical protein
MSIIEEVLVIDKMLNELGYNTEEVTVDEVLNIRKAIKAAVSKTKLLVKEEV